MADTDAFFTPPPTDGYELTAPSGDGDQILTFPSAFTTPQPENNTVYCRYFPAAWTGAGATRAAVLVLPQWNSDPGGHVGLCRLLAMSGMTALRLSLPYHDRRMPPELAPRRLHRQRQRRAHRAGVPPGGARCAARDRLARRGGIRSHRHSRHQPRLVSRAADERRTSRSFARRRSITSRRTSPTSCGAASRPTTCARGSTATSSSICFATLWKPISPRWYLERLRDRQTLLVYARYDLTFPVDLSGRSRSRVPRARDPARSRRPAVRPLQHRESAVQVCRRLGADPVFEESVGGVRLRSA